MDKNKIKQLFDRITVKLHNDGVGNLDVAYIDYDDTSDKTMVMKPVFVAFHDRDICEYFKLAFTADQFEVRPTIDNPLADPTVMAMHVYQTVKSYYISWRKQQLAGGSWDSQSKLASRLCAGNHDPKPGLATEIDQKAFDKLAQTQADLYGDWSGLCTKSEVDKHLAKGNLGTASHTSAPWEDPLVAKTRATDIHKQYDYMMSRRLHYIERAIEVLKAKKHFTFFFTKFEAASMHIDEGSFNCKISLSTDSLYVPHCSTVRHLDFDIPDRMFSHARHLFDDSVHIPADEKYLSEGHLILRIAYIIHQAAKLRETEKIRNEVIRTNRVYHTDDPNTLRNLETYVI